MESLTRGLLRGLDERPVEAPLTDRDLSEHQDILVKHPVMFIFLDTHTSSVSKSLRREFTRNELHQLIVPSICMLYSVVLDIFLIIWSSFDELGIFYMVCRNRKFMLNMRDNGLHSQESRCFVVLASSTHCGRLKSCSLLLLFLSSMTPKHNTYI